MKLLKLFKLMKPESLQDTRKRIRNELKQANLALVYRNVFYDGTEGYKRERVIYDN